MYRSLQSIAGLNPFPDHDSASRVNMFCAHLGQRLVVNGMSERYYFTGVEQELGKYTFSVKMPSNGRVMKIVERYPNGIGLDSIKMNPETVVIYEDLDSGEIGMFEMPTFRSYHTYFGFEYQPQPSINQLAVGNVIEKGTTFLDSPGIKPNGNYVIGRELKACFMSHPAISEDGIVISRSALEHFKFKTYETIIIEWGEKRFPLNLYGSNTEYKIFPDIGEVIRPDGILMALRHHNTELACIQQSYSDLQEVDNFFDKRYYADGGGGKVIDIKVNVNENFQFGQSPMDKQLEKYIINTQRFYQEIISFVNGLTKLRGGKVQLSKPLHRLMTEAIIAVNNDKNLRLCKLHKKTPLDTYRVEFTVEYTNTPTVGFKFTDLHGCKGVVCYVAEDDEMPVDELGVRAEIIMDSFARVNRMNIGGLHEQYFNSISWQIAQNIRNITGISKDSKSIREAIELLHQQSPEVFMQAYNYLLEYYRIVSPVMYAHYSDLNNITDIYDNLTTIISDMIYIFAPPEYSNETVEMIKAVETTFKPHYGCVTYKGYDGRQVKTTNKLRIGSVYFVLLEKTADDWSATASGRTQHFGVLSQLTKGDKFNEPIRAQPVKIMGETEGRIFANFTSAVAVAEIQDRNNNPETHKEVVYQILNAQNPTNIQTIVDRSKIPYGNTKPLQLIDHITSCGGWRFVYKSNSQAQPTPIEDTRSIEL